MYVCRNYYNIAKITLIALIRMLLPNTVTYATMNKTLITGASIPTDISPVQEIDKLIDDADNMNYDGELLSKDPKVAVVATTLQLMPVKDESLDPVDDNGKYFEPGE